MSNMIVNGVEENIFQVMWDNTPTITIFFIGVFASGYVVYQVMRFYGRFEKLGSRFEKLETEVHDLGTRVTKVEQRLDAIEIRLVVIETRLDVLEQKVDKLGEKFDRLIEILLVKNKESS